MSTLHFRIIIFSNRSRFGSSVTPSQVRSPENSIRIIWNNQYARPSHLWCHAGPCTFPKIFGILEPKHGFKFTKARLHQRHKETTDISKRIVRMVIETNTLAMAVSVLSLILFCGTPNTTYFICPTMVLATLYTKFLPPHLRC
jgi:hypothetical protein